MLIDNKIDYLSLSGLSSSGIKSVVDFIRRYTGLDSGRKGSLDVVTGFFTIAGLDLLYKELAPENKYRLVLSELAGNDDFMSRVINLLQGDAGIEASLNLSQAAQNAIAFLRRETVEVKAITNSFCHAKAYIYDDATDDTHDYYVMGSSNLTEAGLGMCPSSNVELNFAQTGSTNSEYAQLRAWFKLQWEEVAQAKIPFDPCNKKSELVDVKQYFIDRIEECFGRTRTPEEIYYKILFELFNGELCIESELENQKEMTLLQDSTIYRTLFDYQKKGVVSLIKMLRNWNGAILADAVGLGKTFSALAVMKYFQNNGYQVLMLCPKKLEQNWLQYLRRHGSRFERDEFDYIVRFHTDLQDDRMDNHGDGVTMDWLRRQQKLLVVIDESHNLRNDKSSRYEMLMDDLLRKEASDKVRDVKVLLLSATPINNGLLDIRNQFKLLAKGDDGAFNTPDFEVSSLEIMFRDANARFKTWCERRNHTIREFIDTLPPHFFDLTDKLIVARTRRMIERTLGENLGFPEKARPDNRYVGIARIGDYESIADVYDAMLKSNLTAYQPTQYMKSSVRTGKNTDWQDNTYREKFLVKMMAVLFMKRLESCWYSCLLTIEKVLKVHESTLEKVNLFLERRGAGVIGVETPDSDGDDSNSEEEDFTLRNATIDLSKMERIEEFRRNLEADVQALNEFYVNLAKFQQKFNAGDVQDEKLSALIGVLEAKQTKPNRKAIVFTTFGDTAKYLYDQVRAVHPEWRIACITGQNVFTPHGDGATRFQTVLRRFAPYSKLYKERDWTDLYTDAGLRETHYDSASRKWNVDFDLWRQTVGELEPDTFRLLESEIDILIATDCLSEGQNLQDSDLVINYDIHWNPVRLIQRFGRIDRIGSPNALIGAVNFWPTKSYNEFLNLTERINNRMALMRLAGSEIQSTDEELARIVRDDPTIDRDTQKLLEQIAHADIGEIEQNDLEGEGSGNLGLEDFSLEVFRQDLVDFFEKHRELFRQMPAGVFSGFKVEPNLFERIPESLVAVLGYPRRKEGEHGKPYERVYLMMQPSGTAPAEWKELSTGGILNFLRRNKNAATSLPEWILKNDREKIGRLSKTLQDWMNIRKPAEVQRTLGSLFAGTTTVQASAPKIEDVFKPENFDLIAWEYVSR